MPSILITGASVAGPTLAHWAARHGWEVTVAERAPRLRPEGHNVDVRGAARQVIAWMGLEDALREAGTGEEGTELVDDDGRTVAAFPVQEGASDGPTAELEVLRGRLGELLHDSCPDDVRWRFGEVVAAVEDRPDGAHVTFASGEEGTFDVVAVAEGQRSSTREMTFGEVPVHRLGAAFAYLTIPREADDRPTWRWQNLAGGRQVHLRPDDVGTTRALLGLRNDDPTLPERPVEEQVALLREAFAGASPTADRIFAHLDPATMYLDDLTQVLAPTWSRGRVVLLGDAAHCVTPLGGGGTALAIIGGYVLAQELGRGAGHVAAFAAYERTMRPQVERAQQLPPGTPRLAMPESRLGVKALRAMGRVAATGVVQRALPDPVSFLDEIELEPPARGATLAGS